MAVFRTGICQADSRSLYTFISLRDSHHARIRRAVRMDATADLPAMLVVSRTVRPGRISCNTGMALLADVLWYCRFDNSYRYRMYDF